MNFIDQSNGEQAEDKFVNGEFVAKDRIIYEPLIHPNTKS